MLTIILLNRQRNPYLRVASLVIAMAAGYIAAWAMGMLPYRLAGDRTGSYR
jgi:xanthine permease XanP